MRVKSISLGYEFKMLNHMVYAHRSGGVKQIESIIMLSSIESEFFYLSEFSDSVVDIREQFPLFPLNVSQKIALAIGVEHPTVPSTGDLNIITTDFLLTLQRSEGLKFMAVCVKPKSELKRQRVLEKIDIERIWWELLGVEFQCFTGNELTKNQSRNISWATAPFRADPEAFSSIQSEQALSKLQLGKNIISEVCDQFVIDSIVEPEKALNLLRYLISEKLIDIDMSFCVVESGVLDVLNMTANINLVANGSY